MRRTFYSEGIPSPSTPVSLWDLARENDPCAPPPSPITSSSRRREGFPRPRARVDRTSNELRSSRRGVEQVNRAGRSAQCCLGKSDHGWEKAVLLGKKVVVLRKKWLPLEKSGRLFSWEKVVVLRKIMVLIGKKWSCLGKSGHTWKIMVILFSDPFGPSRTSLTCDKQ
jgi:hypothetical protein